MTDTTSPFAAEMNDELGSAWPPLDLHFTATVETGADRAIVRFAGELDLSSHQRCRRSVDELAAVTDRAIVFDLSRLSFIDGAGLVLLAEAAGRLSGARRVSFVIATNGPVRRVVELLRRIDGELFRAIREEPGPPQPTRRRRSGRSPLVISPTD